MQDQRSVPCKPGKQHRFTVTTSLAGWKNCWHCGASSQVADGSYWSGRAFSGQGRRRR